MVDSARANHLNAAALARNVETQVNLLWMNSIISDSELDEALEKYGAIGDKTNRQKILDNLGNIRKLKLLGKITQEMANKKAMEVIKNE